jgi:4-hydroxymandelate oxidase
MSMFAARPPASPPGRGDLHLVRAAGSGFTGPPAFLADPANRTRVSEYLADMARPYAIQVRDGELAESPGQSYGEMAAALIGQVTSADEPADLLVLAFSIHDLWPGRQAAAYLSHVTPGAPMAFAICDQGSAAAFSGLRIISEYASAAAIRRALLIVVEQAALPYDSPAVLPAQNQGVAMLYSAGSASASFDSASFDSAGPDSGSAPPLALARMLPGTPRQHPGVPPGAVADLAAADLAELTADHHEAAVVIGAALAEVWTAPAAKRIHVMPPGQPSTAVWQGLTGELTGREDHPDLVVVADYDPDLHYLSVAAFETG